jgi:hypothetical protein
VQNSVWKRVQKQYCGGQQDIGKLLKYQHKSDKKTSARTCNDVRFLMLGRLKFGAIGEVAATAAIA